MNKMWNYHEYATDRTHVASLSTCHICVLHLIEFLLNPDTLWDPLEGEGSSSIYT